MPAVAKRCDTAHLIRTYIHNTTRTAAREATWRQGLLIEPGQVVLCVVLFVSI